MHVFEVDCGSMARTIMLYTPVLRFSEGQRCFPSEAESWLSHANGEAWTPDTPHRGTALLAALTSRTGGTLLGGSAGNGHRVRLTNDADPDSIGNLDYATTDGSSDVFLDVGGWTATASRAFGTPPFRDGDADYLYALYANRARAVDPTNPEVGFPPGASFNGNDPTLDVVAYAEVDWGGRIARAEEALVATGRIGVDRLGAQLRASGRLNSYLILHYYLLYPFQEVSPTVRERHPRQAPHIHWREGHWEVVSLLFRADRVVTSPAGQPERFVWERDEQPMPRFVVYSQGGVGDGLDCEARPWRAAPSATPVPAMPPAPVQMTSGSHPVVFVALGAPANLFERGEIERVRVVGPVAAALDWASALHAGVGLGLLAFAGILLGLGVLAGPAGLVAAIAVAVVGAALLLLAGLLWLLARAIDHFFPVFDEMAPAVGAAPGSRMGRPALASDTGPAATTDSGAGVGTGAPASVSALRVATVVNLLDPAGTCAVPAWWNYTGRWGVDVVSNAEPHDDVWDPGRRRVDRFGRSLGTDNFTKGLLNVMTQGLEP